MQGETIDSGASGSAWQYEFNVLHITNEEDVGTN